MLKQGQVLNSRYQIHAVLGEGGFGAVYKVWDDNLQRHCAIKENLQVTPESQKQFKREAVMLANLNHPHLVRVTDYFIISNQGQYLVMDFVDGIDLQTALVNYGKALPLADTLKWTLQICDALTYIHSQNPPIIHRDIKPANIRITSQGNAVRVDFGLAKIFEANAKTSTGARGLTPYFAAPEQYGMGGTDAQSDIYSLGVTLYCMLTNHVPPDSVDIMVGNANPPPPAKAINNDIPEFVSDAMQCSMQIRRTDRYKSVIDFKNALRNETKEVIQVSAIIATESEEDVYRKAISVDPNNALNYYYLGELLRNQKRNDEAVDAYRKAIAIEPKHAKAYLGLGRILSGREAEYSFRQAIEADPNCAAAYSGLGYLLENEKRLKEAEQYYRKAIAVDATNSFPYVVLGKLLWDQNRLKDAEEVYRKAIMSVPGHLFYTSLGGILEEQKRYKEAEEMYRNAIAEDPNDSFPYCCLGGILKNQKRFKEAEQAYRQAIAISPDDTIYYYSLGDFFKSQRRLEEAEEVYRQAIELIQKNLNVSRLSKP